MFRICHIVLPCLLSKDRTGYLWPSIPGFWKLLDMYFGNESVGEWKSVLSQVFDD